MKFNRIGIVCIFLLAILMFGAVSASDELMTDNDSDVLSVNDDSELSIDDTDNVADEDVLEVSNDDASDIDDEADSVLQSEDTEELAETGSAVPDIKIYSESGSDNFTYNQFNINRVIIELPDDATGDFKILINDKEVPQQQGNVPIWNKSGSKILLNLYNYYGRSNLTFNYEGDSVYAPLNVSHIFTNKAVIEYSTSVYYGFGDAFAELYLPETAQGSFVAIVDGNIRIETDFPSHYEAIEPYLRSAVALTSHRLAMGTHNIHVYYDGIDFEVDPVDFVLEVNPKIVISGDVVEYGNSMFAEIILPNDANGTLYVSSGSYKASKQLENGQAIIFIKSSDVGVGIREITAYFISDNQNYSDIGPINKTVKFKPELDYSNVPLKVFATNRLSVKTHDKNINGVFKVVVDNKDTFTQQLKDGIASIYLSSITAGKHTIVGYYYDSQGRLVASWDWMSNYKVEKASAPRLTASDLAMFYKDGSTFKVKVIGVDGNIVKNGAVVIKINGKTVKTVKTDANGYAVYKVDQLPKKYTISASYGKTVISKKLTVKQPLTLKKVKVKKSAKKLILTAKLKGKKAYAGKKLIFKFNGKKLVKKTNKNGVAKVKIKKSILKKLKVGKKVKYQVQFGKDVVKRTVKVKK